MVSMLNQEVERGMRASFSSVFDRFVKCLMHFFVSSTEQKAQIFFRAKCVTGNDTLPVCFEIGKQRVF